MLEICTSVRPLAALQYDPRLVNVCIRMSCWIQVCDFGLARPSFNDMPTTIFWTDYVATRW